MKVLSIELIKGHYIQTDEEPWNQYVRYWPESWYLLMGDSYEEVGNCEELEKLFQEYKNESTFRFNFPKG